MALYFTDYNLKEKKEEEKIEKCMFVSWSRIHKNPLIKISLCRIVTAIYFWKKY